MALFTGCGHEHTWKDATCTDAKICTQCSTVEGNALGHTWVNATCTDPKTCTECNLTEGDALGHTWLEATYDTPKTCSICSLTEGESLSAEANKYCETGKALLYSADANLEEAHKNFSKAVELGMTDANFYLGVLCDWYNYPQQDYAQAKNYYETCADNPYAQIALGYLYYSGQGVDENRVKAEELFQSAIDNGYVEGYIGMADIAYDAGDYEAEYEYYKKASEGTEQLYIAYAMFGIGAMYDSGDYLEQDYTQAKDWYERAVYLGCSMAMTNIGNLYYHGHGVDQDYAKSLEWYEKAVYLGYSTAMSNIGNLYYYGHGVDQDYAKSLEWYERAASLGSDFAMNEIGAMYFFGYGVETNYDIALEWFDKSAALGNTSAAENAEYLRQLIETN